MKKYYIYSFLLPGIISLATYWETIININPANYFNSVFYLFIIAIHSLFGLFSFFVFNKIFKHRDNKNNNLLLIFVWVLLNTFIYFGFQTLLTNNLCCSGGGGVGGGSW